MMSIALFIISQHAMFRHGLESLLQSKNSVKIVGQEVKLNQAVEQIEATQPDVVILDETKRSPGSLADIERILQIRSTIRVISLDLNSNKLVVYQIASRKGKVYPVVQQKSVKDVEDLVQVIEQPASSASGRTAGLETRPGRSGPTGSRSSDLGDITNRLF